MPRKNVDGARFCARLTAVQALALAHMLNRLFEDDFERLATSGSEAYSMKEACGLIAQALRQIGYTPRPGE